MPELKRVNYFYGRLLTAEDFQAEQDYHRSRARRHNRFLHGIGVVSGLQVSVENSNAGSTIVVEPGFAIDPAGNELELDERRKIPIMAPCAAFQVRIRYVERFSDPGPAVDEDNSSGAQPKWIVETCEVVLLPEPCPMDPANPAGSGVALARVVRRGPRWKMDRRFKILHTL